jgi:hypothetical protein
LPPVSRLDEAKRQVVDAVERVSPAGAALLTMREALARVMPLDLAHLDREQYVPERVLPHPGIDLRELDALARVERWRVEHGELFAALRADVAINPEATGRGYVRNPFFATPDAEVYAGLIADRRPAAIVEVGGGFSTLVARRTIEHAGLDTRLVVVDPEPRTDVATHADELIRARVEEVGAERLALAADSILFIDSSHVVRPLGDVPWLFGELLPSAPAGLLVHVHDVFLPWDYPDAMRLRLYGEQYVLQALLSHSPRYRVVAPVHYLCRRHADALRAAFGDWLALESALYGGSFWFEVTSDP